METTKNQIQTHPENNEVSLKEVIIKIKVWWKYFLSKWIIIVSAGVMGGVAGYVYAYVQEPVYIADLSFALEDDKGGGGIGGALGLASQFGFDLGSSGGGAFAGDNLVELLKSRSMIESALLSSINVNGKIQTLANYYIEVNELRPGFKGKAELENIQFLPNADRSTFTRLQDSLLGVFHLSLVRGGLKVDKLDKKLSILVVKVSSRDELFAKLFTEQLVKVVSDFYIETKTKKSAINLAMLQHQTDSVRRALNSALSGVATAADVNPNANMAMQVLRVPTQRRSVDVQANQAILTELVKNLEVSKVTLRKETPLIQVIDRPILPLTIDKPSKKTSFLLGGFLSGFFALTFLIVKKLLKDLDL